MERTEELNLSDAARGDCSAYRRLIERYRSVVTSIAFARLKDVSASEDVAQEVFVLAWTNLGRLRNAASFGPWLRQTARYHAAHFARASTRRADLQPHEELARVADGAIHADASLERREEERVLADALSQLNAAEREVILLFYREGRSIAQVAALLELSEAAVKKRLSRARARLRQDVEARFAVAALSTASGERLTAAIIATLPAQPPPPSGLAKVWVNTREWLRQHRNALLTAVGGLVLLGILALATCAGA